MARFNGKRILLIVLLLLTITAGIFIYIKLQNPYGDELEITNLDSFTNGKESNQDRLNYIKHALFTTVSQNTKNTIKNKSIKDVVVRKDSFSQTKDTRTDVTTVRFVVDIESLKQSYKASYQWEDGKERSEQIDEYGTQVTCLPLRQLIYGNFNCVDERILEVGRENYDPVYLVLPYHVTDRFIIEDYTKPQTVSNNTEGEGSSKVILNTIAINPGRGSTINDTLLEDYRSEIYTWLKQEKLNPDRYIINFSY